MPNWALIGSLFLPNAGGWASAITMAGQVRSKDSNAWYQTIKKPNWNPPNWVFGPAWTVLYTGMGYASYMVYSDCGGFTGAGSYGRAQRCCYSVSFTLVNRNTAYFMTPYLCWLAFATCLNYRIWELNGDDGEKNLKD